VGSAKRGIEILVLAGIATSRVVLSTERHTAADYHLVVVGDPQEPGATMSPAVSTDLGLGIITPPHPSRP
jgi:hypothetical protein